MQQRHFGPGRLFFSVSFVEFGLLCCAGEREQEERKQSPRH